MGNGASALARTTAATGGPQRDTDTDPSSPVADGPVVSADENGDAPSQAKAEKDATDSPAAEPSPPASTNNGTGNGDSSLAITEVQLMGMRSALRERLQDDMLNQYSFLGDRECVATLVSLFERTVTSGQNQSGLLIGSAGFGQKQIIASALRELRSRCASGGPGFTHVYLNGTILQNEIEAFKELLAQLSRNKSIKHPALSYSSMYSYLRSLLRARAEAGQPVLVILDGLEHFAHTQASAKQLLLYNLLDWLQFKDVQMGVLGITEDFCIMDSMEKRVRSRFSKLQVVVPVRSFETMRKMLRDAFTLATIDWTRAGVSPRDTPSPAFIAAFDARVDALFGQQSDEFAGFQAVFQGLWDRSRSPAYFVRLAVSAASFLSQDRALLSPHHFQRALQLLEPDYQLATLRSISDHGIALLIGMSHLEKDGHAVFTLEMVYRKWEDFLRKHDMLRSLPTRTEAQRELEVLMELQLVEDAGDPFRISRLKHAPATFLQPEYRAVHLNFEPKTLQSMIRTGSIQCSTAMAEWMVNGS